MPDAPLKLAAFDEEDLAIISAHLQDAVLTVGDLVYLPRERRFALAANRFDWVGAATGEGNRRRRAALHFERVGKVSSRGIDMARREAVLSLLAIAFQPEEAPSGVVDLMFSGGGAVRLEVECVEAALKDLGPVWETQRCPGHAVGEDA